MAPRSLVLAGRTLRNSPIFTLTAAVTIALRVGASTATFSVMNAVLLRAGRPLVLRPPTLGGSGAPNSCERAGLEICPTAHLAKGLLTAANALGGRAHQPPAISRRAAELGGI